MTDVAAEKLSPPDILRLLREGNERFIANRPAVRDFAQERAQLAGGQHPPVAIVSCIDSRAPAETIFDAKLGEMFNERLAGACADPDVVGGLEFAETLGLKVIVVMGHTSCGAIEGAIARKNGGPSLSRNLDGLLARIYPAITRTEGFAGERSTDNSAFVNAVARANVLETMEYIRRTSPRLAAREGKNLAIEGALYDVLTGRVEFLSDG